MPTYVLLPLDDEYSEQNLAKNIPPKKSHLHDEVGL